MYDGIRGGAPKYMALCLLSICDRGKKNGKKCVQAMRTTNTEEKASTRQATTTV